MSSFVRSRMRSAVTVEIEYSVKRPRLRDQSLNKPELQKALRLSQRIELALHNNEMPEPVYFHVTSGNEYVGRFSVRKVLNFKAT